MVFHQVWFIFMYSEEPEPYYAETTHTCSCGSVHTVSLFVRALIYSAVLWCVWRRSRCRADAWACTLASGATALAHAPRYYMNSESEKNSNRSEIALRWLKTRTHYTCIFIMYYSIFEFSFVKFFFLVCVCVGRQTNSASRICVIYLYRSYTDIYLCHNVRIYWFYLFCIWSANILNRVRQPYRFHFRQARVWVCVLGLRQCIGWQMEISPWQHMCSSSPTYIRLFVRMCLFVFGWTSSGWR